MEYTTTDTSTIRRKNELGKLVLMRHGQTIWSVTGQHTGRTNLPLTAVGRLQARSAIPLLADFNFNGTSAQNQVFVSPLLRAQQTAQEVGLVNFLTVQGLAEWDYGGLEGHTRAEISDVLGHDYNIWLDGVNINVSSLPVPCTPKDEAGRRIEIAHLPGESLTAVATRARRFIDSINMTLQNKRDVLVVAHSHLLRVLTCIWLDIDPKNGGKFFLDTASVSVLGIQNGARCLFEWNRTAQNNAAQNNSTESASG
jgi:probable phosphoglycerate mutase